MSSKSTLNRPNFLVIVADDLGFSDIGCFGAEISTPHLDRLAAEGVRLTDFHSASACSPTRSMLLTGTDNHIAGVGVMAEQKYSNPQRWNKPGHEGYMNDSVAALPELLQDAGYYTLISGKWHLGLKPQYGPSERGFARSFALLPGCANHYAYEPQFGPEQPRFFQGAPPLYVENGKRFEIPANATNDPDGFYSSDFYASNLVRYFEERTPEEKAKPFFAFLPFAAPHWPLQCAAKYRDHYRGQYDDGPDALRLRRLEALKKLGLIDPDVQAHPVVAPELSEWDEMTEEERKLSARSMEVYAGMVENMDENIGKVLDYLRRTEEYENTFVMFMSDNGAEGAAWEARPVWGKQLTEIIRRFYDNSIENIGNATSFVWYGPRWAQAATAPNRLYKLFTTEGGIRVPFILRYPGFRPELQDGKVLDMFTTVMDICPTMLDLAGVKHPAPEYKGRKVAAMRGKSWVPFFTSDSKAAAVASSDAIHGDSDPAVGWELFGCAAIRKGRWKIVHIPSSHGGREDKGWQLYDLKSDAGELHDLSEQKPDKLKEMLALWDRYVEEAGVVWGEDTSKVKHIDDDNADIIGGDHLEHARAWMQTSHGRVPAIAK